MRNWIVGNVLVSLGLAWLIVDRVLTSRFPLSWGGPNIGGGGLVVLALLCVLAGGILALSGVGHVRAGRPGATEHVASWGRVLPAVSFALAVGYVAARVVLPGDVPLAGINGTMGVTVDASGSPVLVLQVCRGSVDTVDVVGPNRSPEPNEVFAELTAPEQITAPTTLDLLDPPPGWTGGPVELPLTTRPDLLTIATAHGRQSLLRQVNFTGADLASLDPGTVQYSDFAVRDFVDRRVPIDDFAALGCPEHLTDGD